MPKTNHRAAEQNQKDKNKPPLVLITGASGGFGCEFARQLENRGYRLLLHGRDKPRMQMTLHALKQPKAHRCIFADISIDSERAAFIDEVKQHSELVGLVNNAGFGVWGAFERREINPQMGVLLTDLVAPVDITHALLPTLRKNSGFVINVSSLAGEMPLPYMSTYAAAKAGLTWWSEAMRAEIAHEVRVVTLAPGPSPTGFRDVSGMPEGPGSAFRSRARLIVEQGLKQLDTGGGFCVPGKRHKLLYFMQKIMPRRLAMQLMLRYLRH
ncbi:MAG: SDR family NAD(P)-dependent oxidoreductase [Mariprofundaceae bacterium]|nr:SDR family NAD(P)-dependent oxidoreductase [Mariprofundaceae bacterium]